MSGRQEELAIQVPRAPDKINEKVFSKMKISINKSTNLDSKTNKVLENHQEQASEGVRDMRHQST